jgi:hypothetical protein
LLAEEAAAVGLPLHVLQQYHEQHSQRLARLDAVERAALNL